MKKRTTLPIFIAMIIAMALAFTACGGNGGNHGKNDKTDATEINSLDDLFDVALTLDGNYSLNCDIDCNGTIWQAIGTAETPFSGKINGNGHTVKNFKLTPGQYTGLFGYVTGVIENLNVADFSCELLSGHDNIAEDYYIGGIAGYLKNTNVVEQTTDGTAEETSLSEENASEGTETTEENENSAVETGIIRNCRVLNGRFDVNTGKPISMGIVAGYNDNGTIENVVSSGNIGVRSEGYTRNLGYFGGVVGYNTGDAVVDRCLANAEISMFYRAYERPNQYNSYYDYWGSHGYMGLIGGFGGKVSNCMALGTLTYSDAAAAAVDVCYSAEITNCYASDDVNYKVQAFQYVARENINRALFRITLGWSEEIWNFADVNFTAEEVVYPALR